MSQRNEKVRRLSNCQIAPESIPEECAVIVAESSSSNVPSQKRKEEAMQLIYLNRI